MGFDLGGALAGAGSGLDEGMKNLMASYQQMRNNQVADDATTRKNSMEDAALKRKTGLEDATIAEGIAKNASAANLGSQAADATKLYADAMQKAGLNIVGPQFQNRPVAPTDAGTDQANAGIMNMLFPGGNIGATMQAATGFNRATQGQQADDWNTGAVKSVNDYFGQHPKEETADIGGQLVKKIVGLDGKVTFGPVLANKTATPGEVLGKQEHDSTNATQITTTGMNNATQVGIEGQRTRSAKELEQMRLDDNRKSQELGQKELFQWGQDRIKYVSQAVNLEQEAWTDAKKGPIPPEVKQRWMSDADAEYQSRAPKPVIPTPAANKVTSIGDLTNGLLGDGAAPSLAKVPAPVLDLIKRTEAKTGVPAGLQASTFGLENGFRSDGTSDAGARGIAQLMPDTARLMGLKVDGKVDERTIPEKALPAGARYLKSGYDTAIAAGVNEGDAWKMALVQYHAGDGTLKAALAAGATTWPKMQAWLDAHKVKDSNMLTSAYVNQIAKSAGTLAAPAPSAAGLMPQPSPYPAGSRWNQQTQGQADLLTKPMDENGPTSTGAKPLSAGAQKEVAQYITRGLKKPPTKQSSQWMQPGAQ